MLYPTSKIVETKNIAAASVSCSPAVKDNTDVLTEQDSKSTVTEENIKGTNQYILKNKYQTI